MRGSYRTHSNTKVCPTRDSGFRGDIIWEAGKAMNGRLAHEKYDKYLETCTFEQLYDHRLHLSVGNKKLGSQDVDVVYFLTKSVPHSGKWRKPRRASK